MEYFYKTLQAWSSRHTYIKGKLTDIQTEQQTDRQADRLSYLTCCLVARLFARVARVFARVFAHVFLLVLFTKTRNDLYSGLLSTSDPNTDNVIKRTAKQTQHNNCNHLLWRAASQHGMDHIPLCEARNNTWHWIATWKATPSDFLDHSHCSLLVIVSSERTVPSFVCCHRRKPSRTPKSPDMTLPAPMTYHILLQPADPTETSLNTYTSTVCHLNCISPLHTWN